jgi:tetratricopeptide (TPR) repeat protein
MAKIISMTGDATPARAREQETAGNYREAIRIYTNLLKAEPANPGYHQRLMILYRKLKDPKGELRVIDKAIEVVTNHHRRLLEGNIKGRRDKSQIEKLSSAFMKGSGLVDKKGKDTFIPEPVPTWMKRKEAVLKKLK